MNLAPHPGMVWPSFEIIRIFRGGAGWIVIYQDGEFIMTVIKAFLRDESGATMIEYGLVAALVSVAAIAALIILGTSLDAIFQYVAAQLTSAIP